MTTLPNLETSRLKFLTSLEAIGAGAGATLPSIVKAIWADSRVADLSPKGLLSQIGTFDPKLQIAVTDAILDANDAHKELEVVNPLDVGNFDANNMVANLLVILGLTNLSMAEAKRASERPDGKIYHLRLSTGSIATVLSPLLVHNLAIHMSEITQAFENNEYTNLIIPFLKFGIVSIAIVGQLMAMGKNFINSEKQDRIQEKERSQIEEINQDSILKWPSDPKHPGLIPISDSKSNRAMAIALGSTIQGPHNRLNEISLQELLSFEEIEEIKSKEDESI